MAQIVRNYARVLYELGISESAINEAKELMQVHELQDSLSSPIVSKKAKHNIVDKVFPKEMHNFMKTLCDYDSVKYTEEIFDAYVAYVNEQNATLKAELLCVEAPSAEQISKMEQFIISEFNNSKVQIEVTIDKELIGGFVLKVNDVEYDWSIKGRIEGLTRHLIK